VTRALYRFDYPFGPADVVEFFRQYYGPATRAFAALGDTEQAALRAELVELWSAHNTSTETKRTIVDAEYLDVVATRA
jgi:predicted Zn-dependent peptidase